MLVEKTKRNVLIIRLHTFIDISLTVIAFIGAYNIKKYIMPYPYRGLSITPNYYIILLMIIIIWFMTFRVFNLYPYDATQRFRYIFFNLIKSVTSGMFLLITTLYLMDIKDVSRILLGIFYLIDISMLTISKAIILQFHKNYGQHAHNVQNILIVGSKSRAMGAINLIKSSKMGYKIIGCLEIDKNEIGKEVKEGVKVVGTMDDLQNILVTHVVDEVLFAMPLKKIKTIEAYILLIEMIGIKVRIFPDWQLHSLFYNPGIASSQFDEFLGIPSLILCSTSTRHHDLLIKEAMDYLTAGMLFIFLSPFFLLIASAIKLASKGPVFFKQERVGLNGRKFTLYKFRTMVQDAEAKLKELKDKNEADGPVFKIRNDPRIIPVIGTILRKTSLDELPQLLNVIKGEMSLIGPRPPIQSEVDQYNVWNRRRLSMKPGLTCLWQIAPNRNDLSFAEWMELDLEYIDNWSLKLDIQILWKTALAVFGAHGR